MRGAEEPFRRCFRMTIARAATPTVTFVDEYCAQYEDLFPDVRSYEHFV